MTGLAWRNLWELDGIIVIPGQQVRLVDRYHVPFASREVPSFTECHLAAILHMKGMTSMKELRTLFEALGVLGVIIATGTVLALLLR